MKPNPAMEGYFECIKCNYLEKVGSDELTVKENLPEAEKREEGVVDDKNVFADYEHICEKCGFDKAQVIERQPYISDEDTLTFLKCGKCGYTIQLSRKIG